MTTMPKHHFRRSVLGAGAALPLLGAFRAHADKQLPSLKEVAARAGLLFGSQADTEMAKAPEEYQALFIRQCALLAPNTGWHRVAKTPASVEPDWEDPNIRFAESHGMRLTGGHLLWHLSTPQWFRSVEAGAPAQAAVERHIKAMCTRYAGRVFSWNVVNEAIPIGRSIPPPDKFQPSIFTEKLGPNYMSQAFRWARAADPKALLVYNDLGFETDDRTTQARREALMRMLDGLQRNTPIDAIGLQAHQRLDKTRFEPAIFSRFLNEIASRGLKILITELDVFDWRGGPDIAARDADVAGRYTDILTVALAETAVKSVTVWGLSDRYTWLTPKFGAAFGRPDNLPSRPTLFDDHFQPKPAFYAVLNALEKAPKRTLA